MDKENEEPQVEEQEAPEVEETTLEEQSDDFEETEEETEEVIPQEEDSVVLSKSDYNKLKRRAIAYKKTPKKKAAVPKAIDSVDLIKLGKKLQDYSDDELDFVTEYANSKDPEKILSALENPFVQQGIAASREKLEKERLAAKPSSTQPEADIPRSLAEKLNNAGSIEEKEKILTELGLYESPKRNPNRVVIRP